jgi:serine/threonine protein kinase
MLQIVHRDIKPLNILYSPTYKKPVFIDFGCSDAIKNTIGKLTLASFQGTMNFCTQEVFNLV